MKISYDRAGNGITTLFHNMGKKQIHLYQTEFYCRQPVRELYTIDQLVHLLANAMNKELVFGEDCRMIP